MTCARCRDITERLIKAEKRARIAEAKARDLLAEVGLEQPDQVTRLAVELINREDQVEKLNRTIVRQNGEIAALKAQLRRTA